jgi:hypothetical protein
MCTFAVSRGGDWWSKMRVGDAVMLRFGGLGGLNPRSIPTGGTTVPWIVTHLHGDSATVKCSRDLPCDPYWAATDTRVITSTDVQGGPRDAGRDAWSGSFLW